MGSRNNLKVHSPFLGWPSFISRQPAPLAKLVAGLMESQWWDERQLSFGAQFQLRLLLGWAINNVPYYRKMGTMMDVHQRMQRKQTDFCELWRALPILTKAEVRGLGDQLRYPSPPGPHSPTTMIKTSGSTGIPVEVLTTPVTAANWSALTIRDHLVWRRDFSKRTCAIRFLEEKARSPEGVHIPDWGQPVKSLYESAAGGAIHIGHPPADIAIWLKRMNPTYLLTYPSVAEQLLELHGVNAGRPTALREIRFMSEPLDEKLKLRLEKEWNVRCADMYSANETGHIALSCPEYGNLHVQSETVFVELLNENEEPCQPGETGRIIVTPLHNLATPLIRYEIGDYAVAAAPCPCGRKSLALKRVLGRVRNYATRPDGGKFWPVSLGIVRRIPDIVQAQYIQVELNTIELRLVVSSTLTDTDEAKAVALVQQALAYPYRVMLSYVDKIERGPTGKYEEFLSLIESE